MMSENSDNFEREKLIKNLWFAVLIYITKCVHKAIIIMIESCDYVCVCIN